MSDDNRKQNGDAGDKKERKDRRSGAGRQRIRVLAGGDGRVDRSKKNSASYIHEIGKSRLLYRINAITTISVLK